MTPYELSESELVKEFRQACIKLGMSGGVLTFNPAEIWDMIEVEYLQGAVLARLRKLTPPFQPGDRVREDLPTKLIGGAERGPTPGEEHIVDRMFFDGERWLVSWKGHPHPLDRHQQRREWRFDATSLVLSPP